MKRISSQYSVTTKIILYNISTANEDIQINSFYDSNDLRLFKLIEKFYKNRIVLE